jgi:hypothetical protein
MDNRGDLRISGTTYSQGEYSGVRGDRYRPSNGTVPVFKAFDERFGDATGKDEPAPYLGAERLYGMYDDARKGERRSFKEAASRISGEMDKYPHLFARSVDCDLYRWLSEAGCYSPIIHLQQTNGKSSSHLPFTSANNKNGIVDPMAVLKAIAESYEDGEDEKMPPKVRDIYLTFEIFPHTSDTKREIVSALEESVRYWRKWIPEDGALLSELID